MGIGDKGPAKTAPKMSGKIARTALERIDQLENTLAALLKGTQEALGRSQADVVNVSEYLDVVIDMVGPEQVQKVIKERKAEKTRQETEASKALLTAALASGEYIATGVITEDSLVAGRQWNKAGDPVPPGFFQVHSKDFAPDFKPLLMGQAQGAEIDLGEKGKVIIDGVYEKDANWLAVPPAATEGSEGLPPVEAPAAQ